MMRSFPRNLRWFTAVVLVGVACGESAQTCDADCVAVPRLTLEADGDFGVLTCQAEDQPCQMDFGVLGVSTQAESWSVLRNDGDANLQIAALAAEGEAFDGQHPAIELAPGEQVTFRVTARIDSAGSSASGSIVVLSDAINAQNTDRSCPATFERCGEHRIELSARTQ